MQKLFEHEIRFLELLLRNIFKSSLNLKGPKNNEEFRGQELSKGQVKIRILSYLYHRQEGANAHTIQFQGILGRTLEANRFKIFLEDLCEIKCIEKVSMDNVVRGQFIYKITDKGRSTIQKLSDDFIREFLRWERDDI